MKYHLHSITTLLLLLLSIIFLGFIKKCIFKTGTHLLVWDGWTWAALTRPGPSWHKDQHQDLKPVPCTSKPSLIPIKVRSDVSIAP